MPRIDVETIPGELGDEPASFVLLGKRFSVRELIDRWFGEDHAYFKVRGDDGVIYILRYALTEAEWEMVLMDASSCDASGDGKNQFSASGGTMTSAPWPQPAGRSDRRG